MNKILAGDSEAIDDAIRREKANPSRYNALVAERYYDYHHDILENRIFYINDNDQLVEDPYASNIRIPHAFFTEIVDQSVQTELSNPVQLNVEDDKFQYLLNDYWDSGVQVFLQEILEGASKKGKEYAYVRKTGGDLNSSKVTFQISDSLKTFEVIDENGDTVAVVRFYDRDLMRDNKLTPIEHCEIWDEEQVTFYVKNEKDEWIKDKGYQTNPRPHILATRKNDEGEEEIFGGSYGRIPFFKLKNNQKEKTDLEPIKELIDDYDLMNAMMSNNLQDYQGAIYVTKGYPGDDLSKLKMNVRGKGALNVGKDGDFDLKTYDIPVEGRIQKMEHDKANIYKFGMGFDSTAISDNNGNVTNVQIVAGYSLLMMKLNKKEKYLRMLIDWMLEIIVEDINKRHDTSYSHTDIEVIITRETAANKLENAEIARNEAEEKRTLVEALVMADPYISDLDITEKICEYFDLDFEEVQKRLQEDDGYLDDSIDDEEVDDNGQEEAE